MRRAWRGCDGWRDGKWGTDERHLEIWTSKIRNTRHSHTASRIVVGRERQTADSGRVPRNRKRRDFSRVFPFRRPNRAGCSIRGRGVGTSPSERARSTTRPRSEACFRTRRAGGAGGNRARASSIRSAAARRARRDANSEERVPLRATPWCWAECSARWRDGRRTSTRCASRPSIAPRETPPTRVAPSADATPPSRSVADVPEPPLLPPRPQFEVQVHNAYNLLPGTKALQVLWKRGNKVAATKVRARDHREPPAPPRE